MASQTSFDVPTQWICESAFHPTDAHAGSPIMQLTSQVSIATSIYCEDPYCSVKCGRIAVVRSMHTSQMLGPMELWVIDMQGPRSILIDSDTTWTACAQHAYGDYLVYPQSSTGNRQLVRLCVSTLEREVVWQAPADHPGYHTLGSLSPDSQYYTSLIKPAPNDNKVVVVDFEKGTETVIAEGPDFFNPHPRFDRINGQYVLVQWNRGGRFSTTSMKGTSQSDMGVTLIAARRDGSETIDLPIAKPHINAGVSGHESWVTGKNEFVYSLSPMDQPYDDGQRIGNLLAYRLGDDKPRVLAHNPDIYYGHVSTSHCGRYWCCDAWNWTRDGSDACCYAPQIVLGSMHSGKFATLCEVGGFWPRYESGHSHPYMTADNKNVIFGSTRTGLPQVFSAGIPEGFLDALD